MLPIGEEVGAQSTSNPQARAALDELDGQQRADAHNLS